MFTKDDRSEGMLTRFGPVWTYTNDVEWAQMVLAWQGRNAGRSRTRVDDIVLEYAARMEAGSPAPAPILRKTAKGLEPLDGVQRLCAEEMQGSTRFSAYIVKTDSDLLALTIRVLANKLLAGHPEPDDWSRRQAVQLLVIDGGMSVEEVARLGGWKKTDVEEDRVNQDWGFKIRCAGGPEQMAKCLVLTVAEHAQQGDLAFNPVVEFLADLKRGRFSNGEAEPFIKEFFDVPRTNPKKMHDHFERRLEEFHEDPETQARLEGRTRTRQSGDMNLRRAMKGVLTITEELLATKEAVPYVDEFFQFWIQVERNLKTLNKSRAKVNG